MPSSLSRGAQIAGAAAVVLLIDLFLAWYGASIGGNLGATAKSLGVDTSVTASAWEAFSWTDLLLFLTVVAALAWVGLTIMGNENAGQARMAAAGLAAFATLIVLYRIVNQPGPNDIIDVKYGAFLGLIAVGAIAFGAVTGEDEAAPAAPAPSA